MARHSVFKAGVEVEVASADHSLGGVLFPAKIGAQPCRGSKFLVEYKNREANGRSLREVVDMVHLRPLRPPVLVKSFDFGDEVEAFFRGGWWEEVITDVGKGPMFWVYFKSANREFKFRSSELRPHQEWKNGTWLPAREVSLKTEASSSGAGIKELSKGTMDEVHGDEDGVWSSWFPAKEELSPKESDSSEGRTKKFRKGTVVEVHNDGDGFQSSWFAAKVVKAVGHNKYLIEYQTLRTEDDAGFLRKELDIQYIRPCPPEAVGVGGFNLNDKVDAFYNNGWREGVIAKVLRGLRYKVYFLGREDEGEFLQSDLRPHQDGGWNLGYGSSDYMLELLKIGLQEVLPKTEANSRKSSMKKFRNGTAVEIQPDDDGFQGSWFAAKVVSATGQNKYLIEYERLRTKDDTGFLREEVDLQHIRPPPPQAIMVDAFNLNEEVEAFSNDGWWEGVISKVLRASRYKVHFPGTKDEALFPHTDLRIRQSWVDGTWTVASRAISKRTLNTFAENFNNEFYFILPFVTQL